MIDHVITDMTETAPQWAELCREESPKCHYAPWGIDVDMFQSLAMRLYVRSPEQHEYAISCVMRVIADPCSNLVWKRLWFLVLEALREAERAAS